MGGIGLNLPAWFNPSITAGCSHSTPPCPPMHTPAQPHPPQPRQALWIGGIALDLPAWRNPSIIAGFLALLGVSITWRGEHNIPPACHILASNHVSVGDLLMLFGRPRRYAHLITPLLPRAVFATRNLPAILLPANKETYEALAAAAEASSGAVASSSGAEYGEAASAPSASGHNHNHHHAVNGAASHIVPPGSSMSHGSSGGASGSGRGRGNGRVRSSKQRLDREAAEAPVHLFPEGGMTNGKGMMAFSRGFTRFAAGVPVVPVALRVVSPFPQVGGSGCPLGERVQLLLKWGHGGLAGA